MRTRRERRPEKPDRHCVRTFAALLQSIGRAEAHAIDWPEDTADGEIDAVFGPYAIQHTSIDTLPNGRARDAWFGHVVGDLEAQLRGTLGTDLFVTIRWSAVQKGQDWKAVNRALRDWLMHSASKLPDGEHPGVTLPGIPFAIDVIKQPPRHFDGVMFARYDPRDQTLSARLRDQICGAGHDKLAPLVRYRTLGKKTLLLLESADVALMSVHKLVEAFEAAFPTWPAMLDELWFVHHVDPSSVNVHDMRAGQTWIFDPTTGHVVQHNDTTPRVYCGSGTARGRAAGDQEALMSDKEGTLAPVDRVPAGPCPSRSPAASCSGSRSTES
jgi:hypothetical protein